jgi:hypothetical protein
VFKLGKWRRVAEWFGTFSSSAGSESPATAQNGKGDGCGLKWLGVSFILQEVLYAR